MTTHGAGFSLVAKSLCIRLLRTYLKTLFPAPTDVLSAAAPPNICFRNTADRRAFLSVASRPPPVGRQQVLRARHARSRRVHAHSGEQTADLENRREDAQYLCHRRASAHLLSALLNQLRVGLNRSVSLADNLRTIDIPSSLAWIPGEKFGYLTIQGIVTEMAGDFRLPRNDRLNNWQASDMVIWTNGRQLLRVGGQVQDLQFDQNTTSQIGGIVTFNNLELFLTGRPSNVDFAVPGKIDPIRKYRQWLFAGFVQDDVRVTDRISLNLGLRYEAVTMPTEVDGKISNLRNVTDTALTIGDPWHDNPSLKNFAPRVGPAWDPSGTVIPPSGRVSASSTIRSCRSTTSSPAA